MKIDTFLPQEPWAKVREFALKAESLGFTNICSPEIIGDPFLPLGLCAMETKSIGLRTAITVAFPRSPMVVAGTAWALQVNSGGRFVLGLGTQVKGHNERRFSVKWEAPRTRLREYVESLRAIWRCWEHKEKLEYAGKYYNFSLMTPEFSPKPSSLPPVPIFLAAVRPKMLNLAGYVGDGVRLHGFCTRKYQEEVVMPQLMEGLKESGRERSSFEVCGGGFIATGKDEEEVQKQLDWIRYRIAFYGSTRTYSPVMTLHGWDDLAAKLHSMSKTGQWEKMAAEIPDEVLAEFSIACTYENLPAAIAKRFGGISDTIELSLPVDGYQEEIIDSLKRINEIPTPNMATT